MKKTKTASDKALELINQNHIQPIPKWEFDLRNRLTWLVFGIIILTGGIAFSVLVYMVQSNDWDLYYFPYFWLTALIILISLAFIGFRRTKKGYRLEFFKLLAIVFGLSLLTGLMFSIFQVGQKFDTLLAADIPSYRQVAPLKYQTWMNPISGMLAGEIIALNDTGFILKDLDGRHWTITTDGQTIVRMRVQLVDGAKIKLIGRQIDQDTFAATEIRPWFNRFGN